MGLAGLERGRENRPMDVDRELARFDSLAPIEQAWTPPSSWYTDPEFHQRELREVFARTWQPVARSEDLEVPGSYTSGVLAGEPWVVVRGEDGELRAFANTCRHKGREVVQGSGCAERLVCGYHAWCYDLEGVVRSAPRMAGIERFDRQEMSLPRYAVAEWGPWVWLCLADEPSALEDAIEPLERALAPTGWQRLRYRRGATWEIRANWKVVVDNYLDGGYHIPHMHPSLDAQIGMSTYRTETFERCSIQSTSVSGVDDGRIDFEASERVGAGALYAWLFPAFMINRYGPCMDANVIVPVGPGRCRVLYEFFFDQDVDEAFVEQSIAQSAVTQREDTSICESVQLGLEARSYDRGRYAPQVEHGELHFHRLLAESMRQSTRGTRAS